MTSSVMLLQTKRATNEDKNPIRPNSLLCQSIPPKTQSLLRIMNFETFSHIFFFRSASGILVQSSWSTVAATFTATLISISTCVDAQASLAVNLNYYFHYLSKAQVEA